MNLIRYLADRITDYFIRERIIPVEDKNIYRYGSEITISTFLGIGAIILIGIICNHIFDSILFLLCFIPIRIYAGGYHADTYLKCNLIFASVFISFLFIKNIIPPQFDFLISIFIMTASIIVIIIFSPIENKHKPLYGNEKIKYKKISIAVSSAWCVISIILYILSVTIYLSVALTLFIIAASMVVEKIKNKSMKGV